MIVRSLLGDADRWWLSGQARELVPMLRTALHAPPVRRSGYAHVHLSSDPAARTRSIGIKLMRPRSLPRDALRKYVRCQARREFEAARRLARWQIPVIEVYGWAVALAPNAAYESMLLMEYRADCTNARRYLETTADKRLQWALLSLIADDVIAIYRRGFHHNDCHLGNVLVDRQGQRTWIDNELRSTRSRSQQSRRLTQTLDLIDRSMKNAVDANLKCAFRQRCLAGVFS